MVDYDCVAYSITVEIFFASKTSYKQLSLNIVTTLLIVVHYYSGYLDQSTGSHITNKLGARVVLRTYYCIAYAICVEICFT